MKRILYIFILSLMVLPLLQPGGGLVYAQTTYYVSSSTGNDANNGTSMATPWKSVEKTQSWGDSHPYQPGDSILFKRGDVFDGQLRLQVNGTASSMSVIGAYGTGNKPIIRGDMFARTWTAI